jgi:hypothetical protein
MYTVTFIQRDGQRYDIRFIGLSMARLAARLANDGGHSRCAFVNYRGL